MENRFSELFIRQAMKFFKDAVDQVREINAKYANPHLKTSKAVKISLLLLRVYLILLVGILFFKFYTVVVK